ncbi:MAG TPA: multicopper oxidase domain-containing protein [Pseudonocardiaceae bacterium]|jgi:hephaestin|nr:multicopper oxidase domain-containing protein [Pseudonocardiaceae bacterium]
MKAPGGRGRIALLAVLAVLVATPIVVSAACSSAGGATGYAPRTRTYYLAADEVRWNYYPVPANSADRNALTGKPLGDTENTFLLRGPDRIGSTYLKSLYREYTDATFTKLSPRPPQWEHLGMLGPALHAVVGDRVDIVFKNNLDHPASIHMHGLEYDKKDEGAPYVDGAGGESRLDGQVPPGGTHTYHYMVPERSGPGPMDPSSIMWMYHSHTEEVTDDYAGLTGAVLVTRADAARADGTPSDVDREIVLQFQVQDENQSSYLDRNITTFAGRPDSVQKDDEGFVESNLMHSINGYLYGSQPLESLAFRRGEHIRWYLMGMGTEVDLHTPHWHGNTVTFMGMRTDVVSLLPATMVVADMTPDAPGSWLLHCHVNDHITAGMSTRYQVK